MIRTTSTSSLIFVRDAVERNPATSAFLAMREIGEGQGVVNVATAFKGTADISPAPIFRHCAE